MAMRSRLFSMVRVAMIAGTAHAYADSSGMKLLPFSPTRDIVRSAMTAARERYPESSRIPITRNSRRICGRKTSTEPVPFHMPLTIRELNIPCGRLISDLASHSRRGNAVTSSKAVGQSQRSSERRRDNNAEDDCAPGAVQEYGVEALRPNRSGRTAILRIRAHL